MQEETSNTWYDLSGSNFHIPMRPEHLEAAAAQELAAEAGGSALPTLLPPEDVPQLPQVRQQP